MGSNEEAYGEFYPVGNKVKVKVKKGLIVSPDEATIVTDAKGNPLIIEHLASFKISEPGSDDPVTQFDPPVIIEITENDTEARSDQAIWVYDNHANEVRIYPHDSDDPKLVKGNGKYTLTVKSLPDTNVGWGGVMRWIGYP